LYYKLRIIKYSELMVSTCADGHITSCCAHIVSWLVWSDPREKVELMRGLSLELVIDRGKAGAYRSPFIANALIKRPEFNVPCDNGSPML
jgi:hypothetical protein